MTVTVAGVVTFFQLEKGAFQSSAIVNTGLAGTAVSRNADVLSNVSAGNLPANGVFSITGEITPSTTLGSTTVFHWGTYVDASNYTAVLSDGTNLIARKRIGGSNHDATVAFTRTVGTAVKYGARFDGVNGVDIWLSGTKGTNDSTTTAAQIGTSFQEGADGNGANQDFCAHRNRVIYDRGVSDGRMAALTS